MSSPAAKRDTIVVPVVSLEEVPRLTPQEREELVASLKETEADMQAGNYDTYSPEWLKDLFQKAYLRSDS